MREDQNFSTKINAFSVVLKYSYKTSLLDVFFSPKNRVLLAFKKKLAPRSLLVTLWAGLPKIDIIKKYQRRCRNIFLNLNYSKEQFFIEFLNQT